MGNQELSPSGQPIYRHAERTKEFQAASGNEESIEKIQEHVEKHIGPIDRVFHEVVSDLIHLDILMVPPTPARNYYTLVTCGMSDLPMTVPDGAEEFKHAELMICLPPTWKLSEQAFEREENYWPIRCLKTLARLPHEYDTWLYAGHTIPNGNPAEPYADNTRLTGALLHIPSLIGNLKEFFSLPFSNDKTVHFFTVIPVYEEEMNLKLSKGIDALLTKFQKAGVNELLDPNRKNVGKKSFLFF